MEGSELYPLKFLPLFKNKIWGGNKIKDNLGIDYSPLPNCGEMWILSGVEGNESVVENGFLAENNLNEVLEIYNADLVGEATYARFGDQFPIWLRLSMPTTVFRYRFIPTTNTLRHRVWILAKRRCGM